MRRAQSLPSSIAPRAPPLLFTPCDLTDIAALRDAVAHASASFGPVADVVNNTASDQRHRADDVTPAFWDQCMNVNLRHPFCLSW